MIKRERYISQIRGFYDSDLIKVITGVRRCGKSVILEQIMEEVSKKTDNIIYLDFEDRFETSEIENWQDLVKYVESKKKEGLCYIFLDEIQNIDDWAVACRTLRRCGSSVFITGSNSKLLSREFTKELSGRYVSFRVRPFVYKELKEYADELNKDISVTDYLIWGGFPKRIEFNSENDQRNYIKDLDSTIVVNDIINRYKINKVKEFHKVVDFILISNARIYSANAIAAYMKSQGVSCSSNTVQKWVEYLEEAYVIDQIRRYSAKAKRKLEQSRKLYNCDVSLNSLRSNKGHFYLTHNLENVVYNELMYRGYEVTVYENNKREVDFLAEKDNKNYYIQVAYSVADEKAYNREFSAFNGLSQIDRKIIITNDDADFSTSNVEHIKLKDFLVSDTLL